MRQKPQFNRDVSKSVNTVTSVSYPLEVFFLNIGAIGLNCSTHNQFGLKFKFTQFSMNLVAMVTKKTRWPSWI